MSSTTKHGMTYVCPHCDHQMKTSIPEPDHWPAKHAELDSTYRHLCERCKRFAVPATYWLRVGQHVLSATIFSACPNATECHMAGQYDAACEKGVMRPACLVSIHRTMALMFEHIGHIQARVDTDRKGLDGAQK